MYWTEIHCDVKAEDVACVDDAESPGSGGRTAAIAAAEARAYGWVSGWIKDPRYGKARRGWACPRCAQGRFR